MVANSHAVFEKLLGCFAGDPGEFIGMIEMGVHGNVFAHLAAQVGDMDQCIGPPILRI